MSSMRAEPALDVIKNRHPGLGLRSEPAMIQQLAFQGREETLAHSVVVAVTDGVNRKPEFGFPASQAGGDRRVLAALVGVMNNSVGERGQTASWTPFSKRLNGPKNRFNSKTQFKNRKVPSERMGKGGEVGVKSNLRLSFWGFISAAGAARIEFAILAIVHGGAK